jgi:hypothetical protein
MMPKNAARALVVLLLACAAVLAFADAPRELKWSDLIPPLPSDHPLAKLTRYQAVQLGQVASLRERKAAGETLSRLELKDLETATRKLEKAGVDIDGLLARRKEIAEKDRLQAQSVNAALDGKLVRMPGYLLPLEFSGKEITEFLLVPWVGACIHTPPPPPNQIVHVKAERPVGNVSLFMPIWVTGRMAAAATRTNLYLVDGSADISAGYSLKALRVEPYKE